MTEILQQLLLQLILIMLNAFFAATEIAVISLNEKKVKALAEEGNKKAAGMLRIIEDPTKFLSTIQIGITLAGFLGSAFAADNFAERLTSFFIRTFNIPQSGAAAINTVSVIIITLILSFFTLVLGELVPKRVAMRHKEKLAGAVCGTISMLAVILKPVIWLLTVTTNGILRLIGIDPDASDETVSEEDIVLMLDAGADEGTLDQSDIEYIKNVFKLDRLVASDVMTPRNSVVSVSDEAGKDEIFSIIENEGYSRIPVYSGSKDNITGILYVRDYLLKVGEPDFTMEQAVFKPVFVPESIHLDLLFKEMQVKHNHLVIVVNEYGVPAGIVTMEDILEELVGEIWDEQDEEIQPIRQLDEDSYTVLTSVSFDEFCRYFDIQPEEDDDSSTLNGLITRMSGNIPEAGFSFEYHGYLITVTKANEKQTEEVTVKRQKPVESDTEDKPEETDKSE